MSMNEISNNKEYALCWIANQKIVPGMRSYHTLHKAVLMDLAKPKKHRVLNARMFGEGKGGGIRIKGSNLKTFIGLQEKRISKLDHEKNTRQNKTPVGA